MIGFAQTDRVYFQHFVFDNVLIVRRNGHTFNFVIWEIKC